MYRKEVVVSHSPRLAGKIVISQSKFHWYLLIALLFFFVMFIFYLSQFNLNRKETVIGYLTPQDGVIKVFSGRAGILEELMVSEGDYIKKGQAIGTISNFHNLPNGDELSSAIYSEKINQISAYKSQIELLKQKNHFKEQRLQGRLHILNIRNDILNTRRDILLETKKIKEKQFKKNTPLYSKGYITSTTYEQSKEEFLKSIDELNMIDESLSLLKEEVHILKSDLASIPHELKSELLTVEVLISELKNDLKKLESNHAFVKVAPESGYISTIHPNKGSHINENSLLLSIIPVDSSLIAEFLLPSRSSGFVKHSNKVKVRFDAFPYQKFGFIEGEVISIDDSLTLPSQNDLPIALNEPIYRIRVKLSANSIKAYGQNFKLKIGMMASADIILENRSLLDWILEPIYTIKGNI